jgi:thermitase
MPPVFGRPRKPRIAFLLLLAAGQCAFAGKEFLAGAHEQVVPDQLLVGLQPGADIQQILNALLPQAAARLVGNKQNTYLITLPPGIQALASKVLAAHPLVSYVEPNRIRNTTVLPPNDSYIDQQWALTAIQAAAAWSYFPDHYLTAATAGSNRVKVAIIDTGADCTHPDFMNTGGTSTDAAQGGQFLWASSKALVSTTLSSPACLWADDNGHGTHTAGIAAAATDNATGVASLGFPLQLIVYKALDQNGQGSDYYIAQAMYDAIAAGAQVISMSLAGAGYSQTMQTAINFAWQNNVLVVAAAGNSAGNELTYPGDANFAVAVAATDDTNTAPNWSNYGNWVRIAAPGASVISTYPNASYATMSGTSMATPHVAALGGLLFAANPGISAAVVAQRIQRTAQSPNPGWDQHIGYGVINAAAALGGPVGPFTQGSITGQVTDVNGNPITNATVTAGNQSFTTATDPSTGDANGLFRLILNPGTYTVGVTQANYSPVDVSATVVAGADTMLNVQMGVTYGEFTGMVTYNGVAVAGAVVEAVSGGLIQGTAVTNSSGAYTLYVPAGTYTLTGSAANYINATSVSQNLSANGTINVNLFLSALGTISGTVTDVNDIPVPNAHIDFTNGSFSGGAVTGAAGTYATFGLPAGTYTVTASASGYTSVTAGSVGVNTNISTPVNFRFSTGVSLTSGLIGYWPFNEGTGSVAYDQSGNGYNAALTNTAWTSGPLGSAASFNGSNSGAVTPNIPFGSAFSAAVWVNPASTSQAGWAGIMQSESGSGFYIGTDATGAMYKLVVDSGAGTTGSCAFQSVIEGCAQGGTIASGWHLLTATYDGATAILYLDGVAIANDTFTTPMAVTVPLEIGASWSSAVVWNGALFGLRLYNRALTASEVSSLFNQIATLSFTKTADAASVAATSPIGYTLAVTNSGTGAASSVALSDVLPAGTGLTWSISPAYSGPGSCAIASGSLSCSFGSLSSGGTASVHIAGATTGSSCGVYPNTATATASNASSVEASATTTVVCGQSISFGALPNVALGRAPFSVSATASSGLTVSFASLTTTVCTVSGTTVTLAAIGNCTIEATQAGNAVYTAAPSVDQSFTVTGPTATPGAGAANFANTIVGKSSAIQTFTLQNSGNAPLTIASIAVTGSDSGNYLYTADAVHPCPISPATLAAASSCTLDVAFAPVGQGSHNQAQVAIVDNSANVPGSTQTVALTGTGIVLSAIAIGANSATLAYGASEQFTAAGTYSDTSTANLTSQVTWASSAPAVASMSAGGMATALLTGQTNITASLSGVTSNIFALTVTAGTPASISGTAGSGQSTTVGTVFTSLLQALVKDGGGNLVPNASVTFTAPASGASGTFSNGLATYTTATNTSGVATALTFTANSTAGAYSVTASVAGVSPAASFSLTNTIPPALTITETAAGTFIQGQNAVYNVTVANAANAGPTSGPITMTEKVPAGLTLIGLNGGSTWNCSVANTSCTTSTVLNPGASSSIVVTLSVPFNGPSSATNGISLSAGGSVTIAASNPTAIVSACAVTLDSQPSVADVQAIINEALGVSAPANDLNGDGTVNVVDLQIVSNAVLGQSCSAS